MQKLINLNKEIDVLSKVSVVLIPDEKDDKYHFKLKMATNEIGYLVKKNKLTVCMLYDEKKRESADSLADFLLSNPI